MSNISRKDMTTWVVQCLQIQGGTGWPKEVAKYIWEHHEDEIRASDRLYTWQYDLRWAAQKLWHSGTLKQVNRRTDLSWELS